MDGARFANAVARLGCTPAELTWKAGVDALSFGATKNGAVAAEAVVFFDPERGRDFAYRRMRAGHLISKHRFLSAQFEAWLEGGHWLSLAAHANAMADRWRRGSPAPTSDWPAGRRQRGVPRARPRDAGAPPGRGRTVPRLAGRPG